MSVKPIIIPIASGKGGVGKTLISVNLGFALAQLGKKTVVIDLDFGGANIHTCMGYENAPDGIGNFLHQRTLRLEDYMLTTTEPNLFIIPGDAEMVGIANITNNQKLKLLNQIKNLDADYVILDLGAGSTYNTIDFFMLSTFSILIATPEITSILNAYALLKNSVFRLLYVNLKSHQEVKNLFNKHLKKGGETAWKISDILDHIFEIDPEVHANAASLVDAINPKLIINMGSQPKDIDMGEKLRKISETYLSIDIEYIGFLYRDNEVNKSVQQRVPLAKMSYDNQTYQTIIRMAYKIINAKRLPYFLLDIENYDDSLEMLFEEATEDLTANIEGYHELAGSDLITVNDLLSIVQNLEYENIELRNKVKSMEEELFKYKYR